MGGIHPLHVSHHNKNKIMVQKVSHMVNSVSQSCWYNKTQWWSLTSSPLGSTLLVFYLLVCLCCSGVDILVCYLMYLSNFFWTLMWILVLLFYLLNTSSYCVFENQFSSLNNKKKHSTFMFYCKGGHPGQFHWNRLTLKENHCKF